MMLRLSRFREVQARVQMDMRSRYVFSRKQPADRNKPDRRICSQPKIKARMYFGIASNDDSRQPYTKDKLKEAFSAATGSRGDRFPILFQGNREPGISSRFPREAGHAAEYRATFPSRNAWLARWAADAALTPAATGEWGCRRLWTASIQFWRCSNSPFGLS
jgi:hypothetical protein